LCDEDLWEAQEFKAELCNNVLILQVLKGASLHSVKHHGTAGAYNRSITQPSPWAVTHYLPCAARNRLLPPKTYEIFVWFGT